MLFLFINDIIWLINKTFMKKAFLAVSILALLAAGCSSAPQSPSSSSSSNSPEAMAPSPVPSPTNKMMDNSAWQGTLMTSNNSAKGKYMISVSGHSIYLNTGRDYSQLLGKTVNVNYTGTMDSFTLDNITAK
jgi:hypothetical protein